MLQQLTSTRREKFTHFTHTFQSVCVWGGVGGYITPFSHSFIYFGVSDEATCLLATEACVHNNINPIKWFYSCWCTVNLSIKTLRRGHSEWGDDSRFTPGPHIVPTETYDQGKMKHFLTMWWLWVAWPLGNWSVRFSLEEPSVWSICYQGRSCDLIIFEARIVRFYFRYTVVSKLFYTLHKPKKNRERKTEQCFLINNLRLVFCTCLDFLTGFASEIFL